MTFELVLEGGLRTQKMEIERNCQTGKTDEQKACNVRYMTRSRRRSLLLTVAGILGGMGVERK